MSHELNITTIKAEDDFTADSFLATMIREWLLRIAVDSIDIEKVVGFALTKFATVPAGDFRAYAMRPHTCKTGVKEVLVLA
jgi:hypothetical protein